MEISKLKNILEAVLLAAERTLTVVQLEALFELDEERPTRDEIRKALHEMAADYENRGYQLKLVASGFRLQVRQEFSTWVGRLWEEKPARYTRALLETMALIAYRQPITRGEIEEVRGVSVSSNIIKTLLERDWIKVLGHKDVPGKPALYGTTKEFLDHFNLKSLDQLPTLAEIKDLDSIHPELALDEDASEGTGDDQDAAQTDVAATNDSEINDSEMNDSDGHEGTESEGTESSFSDTEEEVENGETVEQDSSLNETEASDDTISEKVHDSDDETPENVEDGADDERSEDNGSDTRSAFNI